MILNGVQDLITEYKNLVTQYGKIMIKNIRSFEETYIDTPSRASQDCHIMYECINNSLLVEAKNKVNVWSE